MRRVLGASAMLLVLSAGPGGAAGPDFGALEVSPYDPPLSAPAFALPDLGGRMVRLEEYRGKVVLLYFWTTF